MKKINKFLSVIKDDKVILNAKEIQIYNKQIKNKLNNKYNIDDIKLLTKEEILSYIDSYDLPELPKYDGNRELNKDNTKIILENRNRENVKDLKNISKGIVIKRTNLRRLPSNIHFYDKRNISNFDRLQESEILVNTGILILHESRDKLWYFIMCSYYVGWALKEDIALCNNEDYEYFINNKNFGLIIEKEVILNDVILDMSVKLPYLENNKYVLPVKNSAGYLRKKVVIINKDKINFGYLPYTKKNVIKEAFKYWHEKYNWGGLNKGVDCSSFIKNVYGTFGFNFPRNTSSQKISVGKIIMLNNMESKEKLNIIRKYYPSLLYEKGHVLLYLGKVNNIDYVIHASGDSLKVEVMQLTESSIHLRKIERLIIVE